LAVFALCGGPLLAVNGPGVPAGAARHEVIPLTSISPERAKEFLSRLKVGTASKLPGTNTLLITAEPGDLQKAVAVLNLVDTRTEYDVRELGPASGKTLPSSVQIASVMNGLSVGTFANPPQDKTKMRAIVDIHNGMIVAVAPVFQLQDLRLAVELSPEAFKPGKVLAKLTGGAAAGQTIQASALPDPSKEIPHLKSVGSGELQVSGPVSNSAQIGNSRSDEYARERELQRKLREMREQATGSPAQHKLLAQAGAKPEQAAVANPQPTGSNPTAVQPVALAAEPAQPAKVSPKREDRAVAAQPQPTADGRPEGAGAAQPGAPVAAESKSLQPGQVVPQTVAQPAPAGPQPQTAPAAAASATPQAQAQIPSALPAESAEAETKELVLPEKLPTIMLLDLVGKHLGLTYLYNVDDVKGEVSLKINGQLRGSVRVKDLYSLLEQALKANNLITTRKGNIVAILPANRAVEGDPVLVDATTPAVEMGDTVVQRKFELKYIDTAAAKNLLENMKVALDVTGIPEKHMLIVTAYTYRMERVERLLQIVDQPGEPKKFRFRQLRYTMAKTLAEKVKAMAEQMLESVSVTVAESEPTLNIARNPGESDIAYRTRLNQLRVIQQAQRAQQQALRQQLTPETKPGVYLDADERTNRVLMIGAEKQLAIVEQLVDALDVEQQDLRTLQLYRMQHVDAEDVARKLQELGIISKLPENPAYSRYPTGQSRITPQLPGQPRPATPQTPEAQVAPTTEVTKEGLVEEPQVVVVEATNSLLVNATAEQHAKIAHIIEYVDSETLTNEIPYKIYPLENSSPKHLAEVLQNLIQDTVEQQKEGGKIEKVVVNKDEKIKIVPDPNTYSLIVYANKRNQEWIANLITQLDKRRPQVLIDVTLVAITKHDKFDYDLNLIRSSPDLNSTSGITNVTSTDKTLGKVIQTGSNGLSAFYGDKQIQALLDTVQAKTYGRVLAKPKLLVNDNEQGKIDTKDITYVEVTSALPVASGVPGTTGGLVQTSTNFTQYDAGITLDITPHISEGDLLRLDIKLQRSDFGTVLGTRPPDKKSTELDTAVTLPNGATVILGGMVKMNQTKGGTKVPIIGDIPLIGGLFRSIHNVEDGDKLYVFVKAEIIRPDETTTRGMKDLEVLSERNRRAFEKHELEFQKHEDWPGIRSKRIDPPKVLDEQ
jgi:type II secretory pathway component GspD/PulD (secretin)